MPILFYFSYIPADFIDNCVYRNFTTNQVVNDEGRTLLSKNVNLDDCKQLCDKTSGCRSFAACRVSNGCHLKDKMLNGSETTRISNANNCTTYYRYCGNQSIPC